MFAKFMVEQAGAYVGEASYNMFFGLIGCLIVAFAVFCFALRFLGHGPREKHGAMETDPFEQEEVEEEEQ